MTLDLHWHLVDFFLGGKCRQLGSPIRAAGKNSAISQAKKRLRKNKIVGTRFTARRTLL